MPRLKPPIFDLTATRKHQNHLAKFARKETKYNDRSIRELHEAALRIEEPISLDQETTKIISQITTNSNQYDVYEIVRFLLNKYSTDNTLATPEIFKQQRKKLLNSCNNPDFRELRNFPNNVCPMSIKNGLLRKIQLCASSQDNLVYEADELKKLVYEFKVYLLCRLITTARARFTTTKSNHHIESLFTRDINNTGINLVQTIKYLCQLQAPAKDTHPPHPPGTQS